MEPGRKPKNIEKEWKKFINNMPKTKKKFDWEIYDGDEFVDILSMTRDEAKLYQQQFPNQEVLEIAYTEEKDD